MPAPATRLPATRLPATRLLRHVPPATCHLPLPRAPAATRRLPLQPPPPAAPVLPPFSPSGRPEPRLPALRRPVPGVDSSRSGREPGNAPCTCIGSLGRWRAAGSPRTAPAGWPAVPTGGAALASFTRATWPDHRARSVNTKRHADGALGDWPVVPARFVHNVGTTLWTLAPSRRLLGYPRTVDSLWTAVDTGAFAVECRGGPGARPRDGEGELGRRPRPSTGTAEVLDTPSTAALPDRRAATPVLHSFHNRDDEDWRGRWREVIHPQLPDPRPTRGDLHACRPRSTPTDRFTARGRLAYCRAAQPSLPRGGPREVPGRA